MNNGALDGVAQFQLSDSIEMNDFDGWRHLGRGFPAGEQEDFIYSIEAVIWWLAGCRCLFRALLGLTGLAPLYPSTPKTPQPRLKRPWSPHRPGRA